MVEMGAGVPAVPGHVDAAAHRKAIVDHRDLLVMAASQRMGGIELVANARMAPPADQVEHHRSAQQRLERAEIPFQHQHFQAAPAIGQPHHESAQPRRGHALARQVPPAAPVPDQDARVEIPADQVNALARRQHRIASGQSNPPHRPRHGARVARA
jgi:hypothetical protein